MTKYGLGWTLWMCRKVLDHLSQKIFSGLVSESFHPKPLCSGEFTISYPRTKIFFGQNMKIHVYLGPVLQGMCWFFCCFTTEKKFQSWGVGAERSREGLRSAHLLGSCASGMAGGKILTHLPKTTGHAPSGHKTEWPPNSASFSLGSASKVTWPILRLLSTHISKREEALRVPHWS